MKLYTRQGDGGETALFNGSRVAKDDARVEAYGTVDELNSLLGWVSLACDDAELKGRVAEIQQELFILGSELATPADADAARDKIPTITGEQLGRLERWIDEAAAKTEPLRRFILPGGTELAARLHVARSCCRRVERRITTLSHSQAAGDYVLAYVNRLSDVLFAWARWANRMARVSDVMWRGTSRGRRRTNERRRNVDVAPRGARG